jgi:hypothetical protein
VVIMHQPAQAAILVQATAAEANIRHAPHLSDVRSLPIVISVSLECYVMSIYKANHNELFNIFRWRQIPLTT